MKQTTDTDSFLNNHRDWLGQLDQNALLPQFLDLVEDNGFYIVDVNQNVLFWNRAMTAITGIEPVSASICPGALIIDKDKKSTLRFLRPDNKALQLTLTTRLLKDKTGHVAGGMGYLSLAAEQTGSSPSVNSQHATANRNFHGIISRSPAMKDVFRIIQNAAQTEATVLVRGESGSGKELVAKAIHSLSARRDAPFLAVNCAALSSNLLESELFGHVRGAFTGAIKDHSGLFQRAGGGTLFLDEVAEMPLDLQAKLLRVIQERNYVPVGGSRTIDVDVRLVAATHRSLREDVKLGRFREDLMYRLRVVPIFLPPLRERREDISLLIWHFINQHNDKRVRVIEKIDPDAMKELLDYRWPGNIRELHNVVEYAFAVGRGSTLRLAELPPEFRELRLPDRTKTSIREPIAKQTQEDEAAAIKQALAQSHGRAGKAANLLGMSRATFWRKRKQFEI